MDESQNIEFKQSWRDEYFKYISGFANARGGSIFVGIDDHGDVCGIKNAKKLLEDIPNASVTTMGVLPDVNLHEKDGKQYIEIIVRAYEQPISYKGKYYYRSGSTLQELGGQELQNFLLSKFGKEWDNLVCNDATLDDIDPAAIKYFVNQAIAAGRMTEEAKNDLPETILHNLRLITSDGNLRNAAVLLFGKDPQYFFPTSTFRIARIGKNESDLLFQEDIEGNIIQMAGHVMWQLRNRYLIAYNRYEGMQRVEQLEIPEDALREIVYNAIVHRNYIGTDIQMKIYDDHIWLWNFGELPQGYTAEALANAHLSMPRNKLIARVFYRAGFIESWGRGINKVRTDFGDAHLSVPTFSNEFGGTSVRIPRNMAGANVGSDVGENVGSLSVVQLTDRQLKIIDLIKKDPETSATTMSVVLSVNKRTIERDLAALQQSRIIRHIGNTSGGHWEVL